MRSASSEQSTQLSPYSSNNSAQNGDRRGPKPLFIGVITELESTHAQEALRLARDGKLDALQWQGDPQAVLQGSLPKDIPWYSALRVGSPEDLMVAEDLYAHAAIRVLFDAKVEGVEGGSGVKVSDEILTSKINVKF